MLAADAYGPVDFYQLTLKPSSHDLWELPFCHRGWTISYQWSLMAGTMNWGIFPQATFDDTIEGMCLMCLMPHMPRFSGDSQDSPPINGTMLTWGKKFSGILWTIDTQIWSQARKEQLFFSFNGALKPKLLTKKMQVTAQRHRTIYCRTSFIRISESFVTFACNTWDFQYPMITATGDLWWPVLRWPAEDFGHKLRGPREEWWKKPLQQGSAWAWSHSPRSTWVPFKRSFNKNPNQKVWWDVKSWSFLSISYLFPIFLGSFFSQTSSQTMSRWSSWSHAMAVPSPGHLIQQGHLICSGPQIFCRLFPMENPRFFFGGNRFFLKWCDLHWLTDFFWDPSIE